MRSKLRSAFSNMILLLSLIKKIWHFLGGCRRKSNLSFLIGSHRGGCEGCRAAVPKTKFKKHRFFLDKMISNFSHDLHYSLNQLLNSSDDWHIAILENINVFRICRCFLFHLVLTFLVTWLDVGSEILTWFRNMVFQIKQ